MFLKVPIMIIMRFGKNNVLGPKKYKNMTYTKIKFYIILIFKKIPRMNNNDFMEMGPLGGPR